MTGNQSSKLLKITEKKKKFHYSKFGYDSVAKNSLSLSSLVLSEQIPLKWVYLKKSDLMVNQPYFQISILRNHLQNHDEGDFIKMEMLKMK